MATIVGTYTKTPSEQERVEFDATDALATGETVSSSTCVAYDTAGTNVSSTLLSGSAYVVSPYVYQLVIAGTAGETYYLVFTCTTSLGQVVQDTVRVDVVAAPPTSDDRSLLDFGITPDPGLIRNAMVTYGDYDLVRSVDRCGKYIYACRSWLAYCEDEITHGNESVRKEQGPVQSNLARAERWLSANSPSHSTGPRVRILSLRNFR